MPPLNQGRGAWPPLVARLPLLSWYILYSILYMQDVQHKLGAVSKKSTPPSPVLGVKPRVKITKPSADSGLVRL